MSETELIVLGPDTLTIVGVRVEQSKGQTTVSLHLPDGTWVDVCTTEKTMRTCGQYKHVRGFAPPYRQVVDPECVALVASIVRRRKG